MGFRQISERYIENISVAELAIEGLRGLATIDPTIQIDKNHKTVSIESSIIQKHIYTAPTSNDALGWAKLIVAAIGDSKNESDAFKLTKMTRFYESIFDGSLSSLDAFSRYTDEKNAQENREKRSGFGGIGIRFKHTQQGVIVTQVFAETPAFRAGIKSKDIITHINNNSLTGIKHSETLKCLRGKIGSIIDIKILRPTISTLKVIDFHSFKISIRRNRIIVPTTSYSLRNGVLYIKISSFNDRTSKHLANDLTKGLEEVHAKSRKKAKGIILDLRGNPGGLLKQAVKVSNLFLIKGRIISTRGRHPGSNNDYEAHGIDLTEGLPLVVLINGRSASAAEIVAAALQDHARAIVIGSTSFGKGTIQTVIRLPNDGEMAVTWSRFRAPSGYFLHKLGVPPSICVTGSEKLIATEYIQKALKQADRNIKTLRAWHATTINQKLERDRLKTICPTTHKKSPIDIEIAEKLLIDVALYQKVKALSPSIASVNN
jgi:carboxyl-terminal processing protease